MPESGMPKLRSTGTAKPLTEDEVRDLHRPARKEAAAKPRRQVPASHLEREKAQAGDEGWPTGLKAPAWFRKLAMRRAGSEEVFEEAVRQLRQRVDEKRLRETQLVLNELARQEGGMEALVKKLRPNLVSEFLAKGR